MLHDLCRETHASLIVGKCPWCGATISHGFALDGELRSDGLNQDQFPSKGTLDRTLADIVKENGPLAAQHAARLAYGIASCLAAWHSTREYYLFLRPENVVLSQANDVRLLDPESDENFVMIWNSRIVLEYMAPEVMLDFMPIDSRADQYSLGCTLYFLLCGCPPLPIGTSSKLLQYHDWPEFKPISQLRADVPVGLSDTCHRLLAKRPDDRYLSAEFVQKALKPWTKRAS